MQIDLRVLPFLSLVVLCAACRVGYKTLPRDCDEVGSIDTHGDYYQIRCDGALRSGMIGGDFVVGGGAGRFQYHLRHGPGCVHEYIGFRCVAALPGL